jgi:hypothetical protein
MRYASKVTDEMIAEVRGMAAEGRYSRREIAARFGLSEVTVSRIVNGHVQERKDTNQVFVPPKAIRLCKKEGCACPDCPGFRPAAPEGKKWTPEKAARYWGEGKPGGAQKAFANKAFPMPRASAAIQPPAIRAKAEPKRVAPHEVRRNSFAAYKAQAKADAQKDKLAFTPGGPFSE